MSGCFALIIKNKDELYNFVKDNTNKIIITIELKYNLSPWYKYTLLTN